MPSAYYQHKRHIRVKINGETVKTTVDVRHSQSLDQQASTAEFTLAEQPDEIPAKGDPVTIEWIDITAGKSWFLFGGSIASFDVESSPWSAQVRCIDQMEKLRRVRQSGDFNFTGMTDGEAVMQILDDCDIDYDPDDIYDCDYVLGTMVPVKWLKDQSTSGGSILTELDSVFGCATFTVQNNRVIRIKPDYVPNDDTGLYRTYEKGLTLDFKSDHRTFGDRDRIQNVWRVTGVTKELANGCTQTPWAVAIDGNAELGNHVRVAEQTFGSDFIQDESLAVVIARRQMSITNRDPDDGTLEAELHPNVRPGSKIMVIDHQYLINTGGGRYNLVLAVERQGPLMGLTLQAGPPGDEGTITSGVDRVCGDSHSDDNIPGSYIDPPSSYPPFDTGLDDDFDFEDPDDLVPGQDLFGPDPFSFCTTDGSFMTCTDPDLDFCDDGDIEQGTVLGSPPADACYVLPFGSDTGWHPRAYTRLSDSPSWLVNCQLLLPWREVGSNAKYRVNGGDGTIDAVSAPTANVTLYASTEVDPDTQTSANDTLLGAPNVAYISGTVTFNTADSKLIIDYPPVVGGVEESAGMGRLTIFAVPGLQFTPTGTSDQKTYGLEIRTENQAPLKLGGGLPHQSLGGGTRDNGGYVESTAAELGAPVHFAFFVNEPSRRNWGKAVVGSDLGSGYIDHLDYLVPGTVFPGEPDDPGDTCAGDHDGHKIRIRLIPGDPGTEEEPAVMLEGLVNGHTTCVWNTEFGPE